MAANSFAITLEAATSGEEQIRQLANQVNKIIGPDAQRQTKAAGDSWDRFGAQIKSGFADPVGLVSNQFDGLISKLGPVGVGIGGIVTGLTAVGTAGFAAAKQLGEAADSIGDLSARTGLSTRDTQLFTFAMRLAGGEIGTMDAAMKGLSKALADGGQEGEAAREAMRRIGVEIRDSTGAIKPARDLWLEMSDGFRKVGSAAEGNLLAMQLFGRAGLELKADLIELRDGFEEAKKSALVFSDDDLSRMNQYHKDVVLIEEAWNRLKAAVAKPLAATISVSFSFLKGQAEDKQRAQQAQQALDKSMGVGSSAEVDVIGLIRKQMQQTMDQPGFNLANSIVNGSRSISNGIIDEVMRRRTGTQSGLQEELERARSSERTAAQNLTNARGSSNIRYVEELKTKWETAAAAVKKYESQLKALESAVDPKKLREQADAAYKSLRQDPITDFFERQDKTMSTLRRGGYEVGSDEYINAQGTFNAELNSLLRNQAQGNRSNIGNALQSNGDYLRKTLFWFDTPSPGEKDFTKVPSPDEQLQRLQQATGLQERMVAVMVGPGGELDTAQKIAAIRLDTAIKIATFNKDETAASQARLDYELSIAEARKSARDARDQRNRQTGEDVFTALLSGGAGLRGYASSFGLGQVRTIAGNAFSLASSGLAGRFELPGQGQPGALTTFGKLLQGSAFAVDPLKAAADRQLDAATLQYQAAQTFAGAVSGKPIAGGGLGSLVSGIPGLRVLGTSGLIGSLGLLRSGSPSAGASTADLSGAFSWMNSSGAAAPGADNSTLDLTAYYRSMGVPTGRFATLGKYATGIGAGIAGGLGVYSGIQQGGARGALTAVGSLAGAAAGLSTIGSVAAFAPALGPIGGVVAAAAVVASLFLGDPKAKRAEALANEARLRYRDDPVGTAYTVDQMGRSVDYDYRGGVRTNVTINVQALDAKSIIDRSDEISEAVRQGIDAYPPLTNRLNQLAYGM